MSTEVGLFYFYYGLCSGKVDYNQICNQDLALRGSSKTDLKSVTNNFFKKQNNITNSLYVLQTNLPQDVVQVIMLLYHSLINYVIGENTATRDCEFHIFSPAKIKEITIKFTDITNPKCIKCLDTQFLYLRLDTGSYHIMNKYKEFINLLKPKYVLMNYHETKVPIADCIPEMIYYFKMTNYKIIDKAANKEGMYYDILDKIYSTNIAYECYFVEYVYLLERTT